MSSPKRRKISSSETENQEKDGINGTTPLRDVQSQTRQSTSDLEDKSTETFAIDKDEDKKETSSSIEKSQSSDRLARFAALKARATDSARSNLAEAKAEAQRAAINPGLLANLSRRSAVASHNLLKADTEAEEGAGAFERKRAWDYTIEESEKWDERMERKKMARDNNAFQDYKAEAEKHYDRQVREMERNAIKDGGKSREEYERQKLEVVENAARSGGLEIVEMENGDIVAIDKDGRFYADLDSTGFVEQKPKKENVDRLVDDLRKAEESRMRKRRDRGKDVDEGDVTYINEKNKQFNLKLARFYDRYTGDIRASFERGTAI